MSTEEQSWTEREAYWADRDHDAPPRRNWWGAAAAVFGLVLLVLGVFVAVKAATAPDQPQAATNTPNPAAPADLNGSVCGLNGGDPGQPINGAPAARWEYAGTAAYPTSPTNGPGATAEAGYRYCYPHTTEGALFAAANAVATGASGTLGPEGLAAFGDYFTGRGPYRDQLLAAAQGPDDTARNLRLEVVGFRVLSTEPDRATVDLALRVSGPSSNSYAAASYQLVWQDGDWKGSADVAQPANFTSIPDAAGYTPWGP